MSIVETVILAFSLSMDAFAVSIAAGIGSPQASRKNALRTAGAFGLFQTLMPVIGFFVAGSFYRFICHLDHWVAFALLSFIGGKMIIEAAGRNACAEQTVDLGIRSLFFLAIATSIDALAAGVSLTFLCASIWFPALLIGFITFAVCLGGFLFGKRLGCSFGRKTEVAGGIVLILLGVKILLEGLFA